jgi:hypothetical protein
MLKTRFNRFAQVIEDCFSAGVWSISSAEWDFLRLPRLAGVTLARVELDDRNYRQIVEPPCRVFLPT